MNRLFGMLAFVFMVAATSLYAGKGQLNIVGRTYSVPELAFDEKKLMEVVAIEQGKNLLGSLFGMQWTNVSGDLLDMVEKSDGVIYVDGKKKGVSSSKAPLAVMLNEGDHLVEIVYPFDGEYSYIYGSKKVFVGADTISTVSVDATDLVLTKKGEERQKRLKAQKEAEARAKKLQEEKNKPEGISKSYIDYMSKFYRDEAKGVVIDPTFKLMWEDGGKARITDYKGAKSYCEKLSYAGYSDWRLPTINELQSIIDDSKQHYPALNRAFKYYNDDITSYWSSTIGAKDSSAAWFVAYGSGYTDGRYLSFRNRVRCVRQTD